MTVQDREQTTLQGAGEPQSQSLEVEGGPPTGPIPSLASLLA